MRILQERMGPADSRDKEENTDELDEVAGGGDHSTCSSYTYCKEITVHKG